MSSYNDKKEKKGGFWSALSGLFRGGSLAAGGASPGLGSSPGLGGLFATKAGILGVVLGGATIAAGVGVIYNFVSSSSKPVYTPQLFQNSYIEEEAQKAGMERARDRNSASAEPSTLDMFREQAKKDGLGGLASEAGDSSGKEASAEAPAGDNSAAARGAPGSGAAGAGAPKLQAAPGFGSKGGGSGTSIPRMQGLGGLSGGIGNQFASVYRPPAGMGKTSAMKGSLASRVTNSPKYTVPNFNKKGAFGQAKYAKNLSAKAAYSADAAGAKTAATDAFVGETSGTGDVGAPGAGAGLGGLGVSNGTGLKGNDPSLNSNKSTPPKVSEPENVSPWKKYTDMAMYAMLAAAACILISSILANMAKTSVLYAIPLFYAAKIFAYLAMAAAAVVIYAGLTLMSKYGQKWTGIMYMIVGGALIFQAYKALTGINEGLAKAEAAADATRANIPMTDEAADAKYFADNPDLDPETGEKWAVDYEPSPGEELPADARGETWVDRGYNYETGEYDPTCKTTQQGRWLTGADGKPVWVPRGGTLV